MRYRAEIFISSGLLFLLMSVWVAAQDTTSVSSAACAPALNTVWTAATDVCLSGPVGFVCNGGSAPQVEPQGPVSNALSVLGALVEVGVVDSIRTSPASADGSSAGVAWLRLPPPIQVTGLLVGDVNLRDNSPPDFPAWQAMIVETGADVSGCGAMPHNAFIVQTPFGQPANIAINGVSLGLNGTVLVETRANQTIFAGLSGQSSVFAVGQDQMLRPGQQIIVPYNPGDFSFPVDLASQPAPFDLLLAQNLPVALLDRPLILPQPGYVTTDGAVNMRTAPNTDAAVLGQVPAGQVLSVLGRNSGGDWLHVRLDSGETGWMKAELLLQTLGNIQAVYDATPVPPQRFGDLGHLAKVLAPAGVNLRNAPDVSFGVVGSLPDGAAVTLLARSPYSPWVKVESGGMIGWLALVTLQTQSVIEALPIDYDVPPPPVPTRIPGSFGNAFPDPNAGG
jgi:uncharacterized protein YraI